MLTTFAVCPSTVNTIGTAPAPLNDPIVMVATPAAAPTGMMKLTKLGDTAWIGALRVIPALSVTFTVTPKNVSGNGSGANKTIGVVVIRFGATEIISDPAAT